MNKAVFLDRDGVIVADVGYVHRRDQIRFLVRVPEAIRSLNEHGFKVIVITNQSGVARGYFTETVVQDINEYVRQWLSDRGGVIDRTYYCPHHVQGTVKEYCVPCNCRKPDIGMLEQAARDFDLDLKASYVVGDKSSDVEAGSRAGCRTVLVTGDGSQSAGLAELPPTDHIAENLGGAAEWIVGEAAVLLGHPGRRGR